MKKKYIKSLESERRKQEIKNKYNKKQRERERKRQRERERGREKESEKELTKQKGEKIESMDNFSIVVIIIAELLI